MKNSREYINQYMRNKRKECKENGICIHCCSRFATEGFSSCEECREYHRNYTHHWYQHKKPAKPDYCPLCGINPSQYYWHHWDKTKIQLGIWLCPHCNMIVELEDRGLVETYRVLKSSTK